MKDSWGTYDGRKPEPPYNTCSECDRLRQALADKEAELAKAVEEQREELIARAREIEQSFYDSGQQLKGYAIQYFIEYALKVRAGKEQGNDPLHD